MAQPQIIHQLSRAFFPLPKCLQQATYLIAHLVVYLIAWDIGHGIAQGREHKLHKGRCFSLCIGTTKAFVIFDLPITDNGFHRQIGKKRIPFAEDERLPEASHTAVAIRKWMDEFEFVVKDTARNQWMLVRLFQPAKKSCQVIMYQVSWWGHMYDSVALKNAYTASAEPAWPFHKIAHEYCVSREHIFQLVGLPCIQSFIGGHCAVYFLNIAGRPNNRLAVDNVRHLFQTERIVLNGKRCMDGTNTIFPP